MKEFVCPNGNESAFIERAKALGVDELVFCYEKIPSQTHSDSQLTISYAQLGPKEQKVRTIMLGTTKDGSIPKVSWWANMEADAPKDHLHYRKSGLNEAIIAKLKEQGTGYMISYVALQNNKPSLLGRIMQNILLCQKQDVPVLLTSVATTPEQLRASVDVRALGQVLGITHKKV